MTAGTTYYYWLEDVALDGAIHCHEPVSAHYVGPTAVGLAGFGAVATAPSLAGLVALALVALGAVALGRRR